MHTTATTVNITPSEFDTNRSDMMDATQAHISIHSRT
jgi:hypothetical protein